MDDDDRDGTPLAESGTATEHATADALVAALGAGGRVDSEGRFHLDNARARDKLAGFQLPDPHEYVLMLVQAAVRQEATRMGFRFSPGTVRMTYDGTPFTREELENLESDLLSAESDDPALRHGRRELAVALNTVSQLAPPRFALTTSGGGARLKVLRGGKPTIGGMHGAVEGNTEITVRKGLGALLRGLRPGRHHPEERLLRERCSAVTIPLLVNREVVLGGLRLDDVVAREEIDEVDFPGLAGFTPLGPEPPQLRIVRDGVWIHTMDLDLPTPGFVALVRADPLRVDLSRRGVIKDARYQALEAVVIRAWQKSVLKLERFAIRSASDWRGAKAWSRRLLREVLSSYTGTELRRGEEADPFARRLAQLRIWFSTQTAHEPPGGISLQDVLEAGETHGRIPWFTYARNWRRAGWQKPLQKLDAPLCLCLDSPKDAAFLSRLMPEVLVPLATAHPEVRQRMEDQVGEQQRMDSARRR